MAGVTVRTAATLDLVQITQAWLVYNDAFRDLASVAATRHLLTWDEFVAVMQDGRVMKFCATENEKVQLVGLATLTNELQAWPTISPPFFARYWPSLYAQRRIWYVGFVGVQPQRHAFAQLLEAMIAERTNDLFVMDFCAYNEQQRHLPEASLSILRRINDTVQMRRFDQQSWWAVGWGKP